MLRRVDALQSYVAGLTGIAVGDQILMCEGVPLDPAKPLAAYKLPSVRGHATVSCSASPRSPTHHCWRSLAVTNHADVQTCCRIVPSIGRSLPHASAGVKY